MSQKKPEQSRTKLKKASPNLSTTKSKPRPQILNSKPVQHHSVSRNLMAEFKTPKQQILQVQIQPQKSIESVQLSRSIQIIQQSHNSSQSHASNAKASSSVKQVFSKQKQLSFELPKSYILALQGLQEAIKARDTEIAKLKRHLKDRIAIHANCDAQIARGSQRQTQLSNSIRQLNIEIAFLRQNIADLKQQNAQALKQKILSQNQHQNQRDSWHKKSIEQEDQIKTKTIQLKDALNLISQLKVNLQQKESYLQDRKKQISQILIKEGQQRANNKSQVQTLKQQIAKLAQQIILLEMKDKELALLAQKNKLDSLETQLALNKQILKEITAQTNSDLNQRTQSDSKQLSANQHIEAKNIPRLPISSATKVHQRYSINGIDRSSNRSRMYREPPSTTDRNKNLISQYRQLMRHQKQLISFNYQMQQLQKSMYSEKDQISREQIQRNYSRLKRQIQKKEMIIAELRAFLNDPINKAIN